MFTIAGTDRSMPIEQVAEMSFASVGLPSSLGVGLHGRGPIPPVYSRITEEMRIKTAAEVVAGVKDGCRSGDEGR